jgi:site-specific recombinase XerD
MKHPNGYGCITKLSGKRRRPYAIRITVGFNDKGTQKYKYLSYHATKKEAIIALAEYNKTPYDLNANSITFAEVYERYVADIQKTAAKTMLIRLKSLFGQCEKLHKVVFKDLRRAHLQGVIDEIESPNTKKTVAGFFRKLYKFALENDIVFKNYAESLVIPAIKVQNEKTVFTETEIAALWNEAGADDNIDIVLILLYSGMRVSELLTLKKEQINIAEDHIIAGSKTEAGRDRYIPIHRKIKPIIERHIAAHDNEYLFVSKNNTAISYNAFHSRRFTPLMQKLNINHTVHETRHTFISKLHAAGADQIAVKKIVGHVSNDTTESYTHIQKDILHATVNLID